MYFSRLRQGKLFSAVDFRVSFQPEVFRKRGMAASDKDLREQLLLHTAFLNTAPDPERLTASDRWYHPAYLTRHCRQGLLSDTCNTLFQSDKDASWSS